MNTQNNFGGRLRPKKEEPTSWENLVDLPNERLAFVYKRLSTHEQVKKHIYSRQAQDDLVELAKKDDYTDDLIYAEERDLGISGTKGQEDREGLAYLVALIEDDQVESVYVVHISRLFRDQTLINAFAFAELCKAHSVIIVTPQMRLNLNDRMHMRIYRMEAERAADELDIMHSRLHGGQKLKARQGRYVGGSIPPGYVLDVAMKIAVNGREADNPNYHKYIDYEAHAKVIRKLFELGSTPGMTVHQIVRHCLDIGVVFPAFPKDIAATKANLVSFARSDQNVDGSWPLTIRRVRSILQNPAYMGWWIWDGELIKTDNHPPIVEEETFWTTQEMFGEPRHRPRANNPPLPLSGLLYCGTHHVPRRMIYSHPSDSSARMAANYQCRDELLCAHCVIRSSFLDGPIGEAVISQCSCPDMAEQVLDQLASEYEKTKARTDSLAREHRRLTREIETLEHNFAIEQLSPERAARLEVQIQERLSRLKRLSDLQNTDVGRLVGPAVKQDDIDLVKRLLSNLADIWESQPSDLQNLFLNLVLDRITVWHSPNLIRVRLLWHTGLEQELVINRPYFEKKRRWTEEEMTILKGHFRDTPRDDLMGLLPDRTWRQIRAKGSYLELEREIRDKAGGGSL